MSTRSTYNLQRDKIHVSRVVSTRHGDVVHVPSARQREPNVCQVVSTRHRDAVHLLPARQSETNVSQVVSQGTEMQFTYFLQGKASRMSTRWSHEALRCGPLTYCQAKRAECQPGGLTRHQDAVHLPAAKQSEPNISQVVSQGTEMRFTYILQGKASRTSARWSHEAPRCGSHTSCKAKRAEGQPGGLTRHRDAVHLLPAKKSEPKAKRAECQLGGLTGHRDAVHLHAARQREPNVSQVVSQGTEMWFTYFLQGKASRTSARWSHQAPRCGSLTCCNATRAEHQPGGLTRHRDAVHLPAARQREPNVSEVVSRGTEMRFTYLLQGRASRTSARWYHEAPRCGSLTSYKAKRAERQLGGLTRHRDAVHLPATRQSEPKHSEPNVSQVVSPGTEMRFTYMLQGKASRTSARRSHEAPRCGSLTIYKIKRAERQPGKRAERQPGSLTRHRDADHLPSARQSEPNVSQVVSRRTAMRFTYPLPGNSSRTSARWSHEALRCGSLTRCKAKRAERQPGGLTRHRDAVHLPAARQREPEVSQVVSTRHRDVVHLPAARQSEPNISQVVSQVNEMRFTYKLERKASRTSARWSQRGTEVQITYFLQGKASRTSARWSHEALRFGSLTRYKAKRAEGQPSGLMRHRDAVHLLPARQSEPNVSRVVTQGTEMRITYHLQGQASRTSAKWSHEAPRCGSLTICNASEPNVSQVVSRGTSCIVSTKDVGTELGFTY
ncbi:hypothetical protein BDD12DRAFT_809027 [Trichophaea hybrida]|nr:hypothetical protein BDD12DRAFT_809027 [Trichophaea hybrida]